VAGLPDRRLRVTLFIEDRTTTFFKGGRRRDDFVDKETSAVFYALLFDKLQF
jgi:hypothetical protein